MQRLARCVIALAVTLAASVSARAAETGSISGIIFDQGGQPVEAVTVTVKGDTLPAGRSLTTTANGQYQFPLLQPGRYVVTADKSGVGAASRPVIVEIDKDSQLDLILGVALEENVTVTASTPDVDLKSTEVNFNFTADQIKALPLRRTYAGLFQLVPGVADNNSFAPNAGASRQDNVFLLDGVNITNPGFGNLSTEVNEFDIIEFNVKRGGITAEFGRASGFVTNAVTRSGTNTFRGGVRFDAIPAGLIAETKATIKEKQEDFTTSLALGGPIVRDRLFFYTSALFLDSTLQDRVNRLGDVPNRENSTKEFFGKINGQLSAAHQVNGGYRVRPRDVINAGIGATDSPETATNEEGTNRVATANYSWLAGPRTYVDVKFLRLDEQTEAVAVRQLGFQPTFDPRRLADMGYFSNPDIGGNQGANNLSLNRANYYRNEVRARVSHLLDFKGTSHQIKAGFGFEDTQEDLTRVANGWGTIAYQSNRTRIAGTYYPTQPSQLGKGRTYSLFVQDDITLTSRLVVNLGVLMNRDEFAQELVAGRNTFLTFGFGDEVQPRIGVNYNLRDGKGDKVYANYGRYYALDQKSSSRSLAPNRLITSQATWDATTGVLLSDVPQANVTGKVIQPGIKAPYTDEYLAGYATPIRGAWSADVFFIFRDANQFIEDVPTVLPFSSFVYQNYPEAERRYRALTFEVTRRQQGIWSFSTSYALTKMYGNFDLDYGGETTLFNTSSLLGDGPGSFLEDRNRQGPLSQDRTHVFKMFGTLMPFQNMQLGGYLRSQSGAAWEARGLPWGSTGTYLRYLEPAGSRRTDAWTNFDLLAAYRLVFAERFNVTFEGRVLNLFNSQPGITVDKRQYLDGRIQQFTSPPGADCGRACYTDLMVQGTTQPNPAFGTPLTYAPARRLYLTAKLEF